MKSRANTKNQEVEENRYGKSGNRIQKEDYNMQVSIKVDVVGTRREQ